MRQINIHAAKTHLSRLVDEAVSGEPFVICKAGKPMVKVIPLEGPQDVLKKRYGFMKGAHTVPENYWEIDRRMDKEIEDLFYGKDA